MSHGNIHPRLEQNSKCGKYLAVYCPDHPNCWTNGYLYIHRIVVEISIGRLLSSEEVVHHIDGNERNNSIHNLEVIKSQKDHFQLHIRPITTVVLVCPVCKIEFIRRKNRTHLVKGGNPTCCSRTCGGKRGRLAYLGTRTGLVS